LPDAPPVQRVSLSDTVFSVGLVVLSIGALFWDRAGQLTDGNGDGVPFLQPSLWNGWISAVIGLLVVGGGVAVLAHRAGRWTVGLAAANVGVNAALLAIVGWLAAEDRIVNPRFLDVLADQAGWDQVPEVKPWLIVVLVGVVLVWDSVDSIAMARRHAGGVDEVTGRSDTGANVPAER
jgi:hypothetical protein